MIDTAVYHWYAIEKNLPISTTILQGKAREFSKAMKMKIENFEISSGWLFFFCKR